MPRTPRTTASANSAPKRRDQEVLDAAARVFYVSGYADASVQDVADELGILKGSLYHYIDTKEDLLFRLLQETHDEVHAIQQEVAAADGLDPVDRLTQYVRRQVEFNVDNLPKVSVYYHDVERLTEDRRKSVFARRREQERYVVGLIEEAQDAGLADASLDAVTLSRCIFAVIIWPYRWYRPKRDGRRGVAEACAAFAISGVVGGVAAKAAGRPAAIRRG